MGRVADSSGRVMVTPIHAGIYIASILRDRNLPVRRCDWLLQGSPCYELPCYKLPCYKVRPVTGFATVVCRTDFREYLSVCLFHRYCLLVRALMLEVQGFVLPGTRQLSVPVAAL